MRKLVYPFSFVVALLCLQGCVEDPYVPVLYGSIKGKVVIENTETPLENVIISTNPATDIVPTDINGEFVFDPIKIGSYTIRAEKTGYTTAIETITVFEKQETQIIIQLQLDTSSNEAPGVPLLVQPADGSEVTGSSTLLKWSGADPDTADILSYDVLIFSEDATTPQLIAVGITDTFVEAANLDFNKQYFWQVVVKDNHNDPVFGPVWSFNTGTFPDYRILFAKAVDGKYDIYSGDLDGNSIQLTHNNVQNWRPRMNPLRTKIAYISMVGVEAQLFIMDRDGSAPYQVTTIPIAGHDNFQLDFCWSPDGTRLLYMNHEQLYTINIDGTGLTALATAANGYDFTECDWTAQGNKILARMTGNEPYKSQIFLLDGNGTYLAQVLADLPGSCGGAMFSIAGDYMLYTQDASGFESPDGRQLDALVQVKNIASQAVANISLYKPAGTNDLDPRFSPDGAKVIFVNTNNDGISPSSIWLMDLTGLNRTLLFEGAVMPDWR